MSFFPHYAHLIEDYKPESTSAQEMSCNKEEVVLVLNEHSGNGWSYCQKVTPKSTTVIMNKQVFGFVPTSFLRYVKVAYPDIFDGRANVLQTHKYEQYYSQLSFGCVGCGTRVKARDEKMLCLDSGSHEDPFIVCIKCFATKGVDHWSTEALKKSPAPLFGGAPPVFVKQRRHPAENAWLIRGCCVAQTLHHAFLCFADRPCIGYRQRKPLTAVVQNNNGSSSSSSSSGNSRNNAVIREELEPQFSWVSFADVHEKALHIGSGIQQIINGLRMVTAHGVESSTASSSSSSSKAVKRPFVGLCSINRIEWFMSDIGCLMKNMVTVGLPKSKFETEDLDDMAHIINNAELDIIICESKYTMQCLQMLDPESKRHYCPTVRAIVQMEELLPSSSSSSSPSSYSGANVQDKQKYDLAHKLGIQLLSLDDVQNIGKKLSDCYEIDMDAKEDDLATIVYTSGSTGRSKGAIITNRNMNDQLNREMFAFHPLVNLSFSPLSHTSDRLNVYNVVVNGGRTGIYSGDMSLIFDDFKALQPTILSSTPRLYNSIYSEYQKTLLLLGSTSPPSPLDTDAKQKTEEELLQKFSGILGGRMQAMTTGGAATSQEVVNFLRRCFKCRVYNGYASTELGAITWIDVGSTEEKNGSDLVFKNVDIKLIDVPELGYFSTDKPYPRGEIIAKTPTAIPGYYRDEENTAELIDKDGYYHTGDIGMMDEKGRLTIIDRKKNIFKLSQGEFVAPEPLENHFLTSEFIDQIFIYGDSMKTFLVAVVVPNMSVVERVAREKGLSGTMQEICREGTKIYQLIMQDIKLIGQRSKVASYEVPKGFIFELERFTVDNGKLTGPEKSCRPYLTKCYKQQLDDLYTRLELKTQHIDVLSTITGVLGVTDDSTIDQDLSFAEVGGDSISAAKLSLLIEQQLDIRVSTKDLLQNVPLSEIVHMIQNGGKSASWTDRNTAKTIDLDEEVVLDPSIFSPEHLLPTLKAPDDIRNVLLTGATGFLGGALLVELLSCPQHMRVHCVVRAESDGDAHDRVIRNLRTMCVPDSTIQSLGQRIVAYRGDLELPKLGLSDDTWNDLCHTIDAVYHNGALVNFVRTYWELKKANVSSVVELLKLCTSGSHLKPLHFVSSISVLGNAPYYRGGDNVTENVDLRSLISDAYNSFQQLQGYAQSKFVAECILRIARSERKIPVSIFRPDLICGHSQTGHSNVTEWISRFMCGVVQLKAAPRSEVSIGMVPVDFVAQAIVGITAMTRAKLYAALTTHNAYHLVNVHASEAGRSISVNQLIGYMKSYHGLGDIQQMDHDQWVSFVKHTATTQPHNALLPVISMFEHGFPASTTYSCRNLLEALKDLPIVCASVNSETLVHKFIESFRNQGVLL